MVGKRNYKDLLVWRRAVDLVPEVYSVVRRLPHEENFALGDQLRRAVVSVAANIAEGQSRRHPKEFLQHLSIAKGSLAELHTLLVIAERLEYIAEDHLQRLESALASVARPLHRLAQAISRPPTPPTTNHQQSPPQPRQGCRTAKIAGQPPRQPP